MSYNAKTASQNPIAFSSDTKGQLYTPDGAGTNIPVHGIAARGGGGAKPYRNDNLLATGVNVITTVGQLYGGLIWNGHATLVRYLKIYDMATAPASTDGGLMVWKLVLPPLQNTRVPVELVGLRFLLGIGLRATTGLADSDNTAPGANEVQVVLAYMDIP